MMQAELMINDEAHYIDFNTQDEFIQNCFDLIGEIPSEERIIISVLKDGKYTGERYLWDDYLANCWVKGKLDSTKFLNFMKEQHANTPPVTFKQIILSRYCGEFQPATEKNCTIRKTSEEIMLDLRPMADFTTNEIAEYLTLHGYTIGFEDTTPVWLMRKDGAMELRDH